MALLSGQHILDLLMLDQHAVMCCMCESAFRNITKLEEKVVSLKTSMKDKIAASVSRCYSNLSSQTYFYHQPNTRKRPASSISEGAPQAKQAATQVLTRPEAHVSIEAHAPTCVLQPSTSEPEASEQPATPEPEASEQPATPEPEASEQPATPEPEPSAQPATPEPEILPSTSSTSPTCEPQLSRHTEVNNIMVHALINVKQISLCYRSSFHLLVVLVNTRLVLHRGKK